MRWKERESHLCCVQLLVLDLFARLVYHHCSTQKTWHQNVGSIAKVAYFHTVVCSSPQGARRKSLLERDRHTHPGPSCLWGSFKTEIKLGCLLCPVSSKNLRSLHTLGFATCSMKARMVDVANNEDLILIVQWEQHGRDWENADVLNMMG